jgi:hypothetical protein
MLCLLTYGVTVVTKTTTELIAEQFPRSNIRRSLVLKPKVDLEISHWLILIPKI